MHRVDEASLEALRTALEEAGTSYKDNYNKLQQLVNEIESGVIKGDVATAFQKTFNDKKEIFDGVSKTIDEAESYIQEEKQTFTNMVSDLVSGMR